MDPVDIEVESVTLVTLFVPEVVTFPVSSVFVVMSLAVILFTDNPFWIPIPPETMTDPVVVEVVSVVLVNAVSPRFDSPDTVNVLRLRFVRSFAICAIATSMYCLEAASVVFIGVGTVTVPTNVESPVTVEFPKIVEFPPILIFLLTPSPPDVIIDPLSILVESVVSVTLIGCKYVNIFTLASLKVGQ